MSQLANWLRKQSSSDQLVSKALRFGLVGALSSAIFSIVTAACVRLWGIDPKLASIAGYLASMPVNFVCNRRFSFRSEGTLTRDLSRFIGLHAGNIVLTSLSMGAIVDILGLHYLFGVVAAVVLVPLVNFFALNWWVFGRTGLSRD